MLKAYHEEIAQGLFGKEAHDAHKALECLLDELKLRLQKEPTLNFDYDYDQLIGFGELLPSILADCL